MRLGDLIREMSENQERIMKDSIKELKELGNASLWIERTKSRTRYYKVKTLKNERRREGINSKPKEIAKLARKVYLESELDVIRRNVTALRKMMEIYESYYTEPTLDAILDNMKGKRNSEAYLKYLDEYQGKGVFGEDKYSIIRSVDMMRLDSDSEEMRKIMQLGELSRTNDSDLKKEPIMYQRYNRDIVEWIESPYVRSKYMPEHRIHRTTHGLWLRSKSEVLIAEKFYGHGIPFRSEEVISTPRGMVVPDFIVPDVNGKLYFWEHAGIMDKEEYQQKHRRSMEKYESIGIVPWKNLIVTYDYEDGSIDLERLEMEIRTRLL